MGDVAFSLLQAKVSERLQRQLAAVIMPALPKQMGEAMSAQHQPGVYGMVLLRAVCAHHYGPHAIKAKLLAAANLCYNEVNKVHSKRHLLQQSSRTTTIRSLPAGGVPCFKYKTNPRHLQKRV